MIEVSGVFKSCETFVISSARRRSSLTAFAIAFSSSLLLYFMLSANIASDCGRLSTSRSISLCCALKSMILSSDLKYLTAFAATATMNAKLITASTAASKSANRGESVALPRIMIAAAITILITV